MKGVEHMTCTSFFLQLTFHFLIILQTKNSFNLFHFLRFRRQFGVASYRTIQTKLCAVTTVVYSQDLDQSNKLQTHGNSTTNKQKQYYVWQKTAENSSPSCLTFSKAITSTELRRPFGTFVCKALGNLFHRPLQPKDLLKGQMGGSIDTAKPVAPETLAAASVTEQRKHVRERIVIMKSMNEINECDQ